MIRHGYIDLITLVWCLAYSWCFAARDCGLPLGASDEHTLQRSVRSKQRRGRPKELLPEGLRRKWPGASLLLSHRSLRICSFVAPRPKPFWAQRNTSYMRDTTLGFNHSAQGQGQAVCLDPDPAYFYRSTKHATSSEQDPAGRFPALVFESLLYAGSGRTDAGGPAPGAIARSQGVAHGLCGHIQFASPRCAADAGGFAARQWTRHSPV